MTDLDRRILATCELPPRRREDVAAELGIGPAAYHQRLLRLLSDAEAEREHPVLIHRLRRLQDLRKAARRL